MKKTDKWLTVDEATLKLKAKGYDKVKIDGKFLRGRSATGICRLRIYDGGEHKLAKKNMVLNNFFER